MLLLIYIYTTGLYFSHFLGRPAKTPNKKIWKTERKVWCCTQGSLPSSPTYFVHSVAERAKAVPELLQALCEQSQGCRAQPGPGEGGTGGAKARTGTQIQRAPVSPSTSGHCCHPCPNPGGPRTTQCHPVSPSVT